MGTQQMIFSLLSSAAPPPKCGSLGFLCFPGHPQLVISPHSESLLSRAIIAPYSLCSLPWWSLSSLKTLFHKPLSSAFDCLSCKWSWISNNILKYLAVLLPRIPSSKDGVVDLSCSFDPEAQLVHVDSDSMRMDSLAWSHVYIYICVQYPRGVTGL